MTGTEETWLFWDRRAMAWQQRAGVIDEHLAVYGRRGVEALGLREGERVLDVGCGAGYCAAELAALVGCDGRVVGVDVSPGMIAAATAMIEPEQPDVSFGVANAQTDELGDGLFDAAFARFSLMLFEDPLAGLFNIARALKPSGRFACLVWGSRQDNPWISVPRLAAAPVLGIRPPEQTADTGRRGAADQLAAMLDRTGFADVHIDLVRGARWISDENTREDIAILFEEGGALSDAWAVADDATREACYQAVIEAMTMYREPAGWSLPGAALLATGMKGH